MSDGLQTKSLCPHCKRPTLTIFVDFTARSVTYQCCGYREVQPAASRDEDGSGCSSV